MITMCPMYNSGYCMVYVIKRSSKHIGQLGGLNNNTAQEPKNYSDNGKDPILSSGASVA